MNVRASTVFLLLGGWSLTGSARAQDVSNGSRASVTLRGIVVSRATGQPVAGADVGVADGPVTRTDARGEWTLAPVAPGTRTLGARALGYAPTLMQVEVGADASPIKIVLSSAAMLDTVRVAEARVPSARLELETRRRMGLGRYITAEDIARRKPVVTTDLLMNVHGVDYRREPLGATVLEMRRKIGDKPCYPTIFIDGRHMVNFATKDGADMIDIALNPSEIYAVEVYGGTTVPPQFDPGMSGCGSIVFWTRMPGPPRSGTRDP